MLADDNMPASNNYSITTSNTSYEPTSLSASQIDNNVTPTKSIIRSNSIRNANDVDETPLNYYNEPTVQPTSMSYVESQPQPAGNENDFY